MPTLCPVHFWSVASVDRILPRMCSIYSHGENKSLKIVPPYCEMNLKEPPRGQTIEITPRRYARSLIHSLQMPGASSSLFVHHGGGVVGGSSGTSRPLPTSLAAAVASMAPGAEASSPLTNVAAGGEQHQ